MHPESVIREHLLDRARERNALKRGGAAKFVAIDSEGGSAVAHGCEMKASFIRRGYTPRSSVVIPSSARVRPISPT